MTSLAKFSDGARPGVKLEGVERVSGHPSSPNYDDDYWWAADRFEALTETRTHENIVRDAVDGLRYDLSRMKQPDLWARIDAAESHVQRLTNSLANAEAALTTAREQALEEGVRKGREEMRRDTLAAQPSTAENPNEDSYQRGRFDGVMEFARAIAALSSSAQPRVTASDDGGSQGSLEQGWRFDMENAPRDGTELLLADPDLGAAVGRWSKALIGEPDTACWETASFGHVHHTVDPRYDWSPIAWMPLPVPPSTATGGE